MTMRNNVIGIFHGRKFMIFLGLFVASILSIAAANSISVNNTAQGGYLLCFNSKTRAITYPGTLSCPSGTKPLELGATGPKGAQGDMGPQGLQGDQGPAGPQGPAGEVVTIPASAYSSDTAIKEGEKGSLTNPVKIAEARSLNSFIYQIKSVVYPNDSAICKDNGFNEGCKTDDNFNGIVDSASKTYWLTINIEVTNQANITRAANSDLSYYLVLANGELSSQRANTIKGLNDMQLIKGGKGEASVSFLLPKTTNLSALKFIVRSPIGEFLSTQDNYFALK